MDYKSRIKDLAERGKEYQNNIVFALILIFIFFLGMGIGILIKPNKPATIIIDKNAKIGLPAQSELSLQSKEFTQNLSNELNFASGNFVASINGKAYYPKKCKAANVIKEENRVWFENAEEARDAGYAPAKNCP